MVRSEKRIMDAGEYIEKDNKKEIVFFSFLSSIPQT